MATIRDRIIGDQLRVTLEHRGKVFIRNRFDSAHSCCRFLRVAAATHEQHG